MDTTATSTQSSPDLLALGLTGKILVADDEPDLELLIRQKFRKRIRNRELSFVFAADGVEALEQLRADSEIDLLLTDINMPRMDGLKLLSMLSGLGRPLRAIVVSAYGDLANIRVAMNRGAFDFVTKPVDFVDLETTILKGLQELQAYKEASAAKNQLASIQNELDVARRIQEAALPRAFPSRAEFQLHAYMNPAREVGGDFYDFFQIDEERLGFVMGDVSGKGVSAAMLMVVTRTVLKATALKGSSPEACIRDVNRLLQPESLPEMFVTIFYGMLNIRTGDVAYCNAGHNPPYVLRATGEVAPLERVGGLAVCLIKDFPFKAGSITLAPGDALVIYTDGVTEAMNSRSDLFSEERLEDTLADLTDASAAAIIRAVIRDVSIHAEHVPQSDDITAMAIRFLGEGGGEAQ